MPADESQFTFRVGVIISDTKVYLTLKESRVEPNGIVDFLIYSSGTIVSYSKERIKQAKSVPDFSVEDKIRASVIFSKVGDRIEFL